MFFINIDIEARCKSGIFDPLMPPIASYIPGKVKSKGISASAKIIQELFETRQETKVEKVLPLAL